MTRSPRSPILHRARRLFALALASFATRPVSGSLTGSGLPWDEPLSILRENITGPTVSAILFIAIAVALAIWAWSSHSDGLARAGKAIAALAVVSLLLTFLGQLGIAFALL